MWRKLWLYGPLRQQLLSWRWALMPKSFGRWEPTLTWLTVELLATWALEMLACLML